MPLGAVSLAVTEQSFARRPAGLKPARPRRSAGPEDGRAAALASSPGLCQPGQP